ncbi:MAG TPA: bifunctional DNA-formamidopyrimidine glycosylase/DNA-(apurinic or apyrimidinic site) lyase [Gemmatimonadaceae bacterium]|jgi:formamidopyrimidine-DNA glycosylase
MPELPEVETIARGVNTAVAGRTIEAVGVPRPDVLREATARTFAKRIRGTRITESRRRAKHIVISLDSGDSLVVQPRFTGALLATRASNLTDYDRTYIAVLLGLDSGYVLAYRDVRRLGTVSLMDPERLEEYFGELGDEPLEEGFTGDRLSDILRASRQPVKKVIMDQYKVVGVGNIYANEALWRAGIDPSRASDRITPDEASDLRDAIVAVLKDAIASGGSSIRDFRNATGEAGEYSRFLSAYGRGGEPCQRCGARLVETHAIDGRQTVLCAHCQS